MIIGIITVILVLGFLIFFHELGHFLLARSMGIGVSTFSLGFGPVLFSRQKGKTKYQVSALPLGGYVALVGETPDAEIPEPFTAEESFSLRPAWQRFLVILAGPVFNLFLAWFICWGIIFHSGVNEIPPVVGEIIESSPALDSPLREGDRIISLNGEEINRWEDIPMFLRMNGEGEITVVAAQPGEEARTFAITPALMSGTTPNGEKFEYLGFGIKPKEVLHHDLGFIDSAFKGLEKSADMATLIKKSLEMLVSGKASPKEVGGPVYIMQIIYEQSDVGVINVLLIAAMISVNLGILNLLPIPVLDGGHILFLLVEMVRRRPVSIPVQEKAMVGGLVLLIGLMLMATFNDIMRIFGWSVG